jgi:hypothetical protein
MTNHIKSILANNVIKRPHSQWWGFVWRGLVVSPTGQHYRAMGRSVWLFLYLIIHANRRTGTIYRRVGTISKDTGTSKRTVQIWLKTLRDNDYIITERTGRSLIIHIMKWRPIRRSTTKPFNSPSANKQIASSNLSPS